MAHSHVKANTRALPLKTSQEETDTQTRTEDLRKDEEPVNASVTDIRILFTALLAVCALAVLTALSRRRRRRREEPRAAAEDSDVTLGIQLERISQRLATLEKGLAQLAETMPRTMQGVGLVRYNPFPDTGGNMSFSVAFLDGGGNGVVISVLNDRTGSRVYGKAVQGGTSIHPLSEEEREALARARGELR